MLDKNLRYTQSPVLGNSQPRPPAPIGGGYGTNTSGTLLQNRNNSGYQDYVGGMGFDPNGNNEFGAMFRKAGFGMAPDFLNRVGFMNEMGPQRLDAIRRMVSQFSPGNLQATADQNRARLLRQGNESAGMAKARLRGAGASQDAQMGAQVAARNQSAQAANQYQNDLYSPEGQQRVLQLLMQAFGQGENLGLQNMMPMFGAVEQRHGQNNQEQQQGGFMNQLAPFLGMAGQMAGGMGGMGGGGGGQTNPWAFLGNMRR